MKGFIIGGSNATIHIFVKSETEKKNPYAFSLAKTLQYKFSISKIMSLIIEEENILFGMECGSLMKVLFTTDQQIEDVPFSHILQPFHTDRITGLDVCKRKTLVATCSLDKTVRVWNYQEKTLEVMREFDEQAHALAFHPSGY